MPTSMSALLGATFARNTSLVTMFCLCVVDGLRRAPSNKSSFALRQSYPATDSPDLVLRCVAMVKGEVPPSQCALCQCSVTEDFTSSDGGGIIKEHNVLKLGARILREAEDTCNLLSHELLDLQHEVFSDLSVLFKDIDYRLVRCLRSEPHGCSNTPLNLTSGTTSRDGTCRLGSSPLSLVQLSVLQSIL